mgnify:CR=1 FL=1
MGIQRLLAAAVCGAALISTTSATIYWAGIDESGGEFAPGVLPGTFGVEYAFVNNSGVDIYVEESKVCLCPFARVAGKKMKYADVRLLEITGQPFPCRVFVRAHVPSRVWTRQQIQRDILHALQECN